MVFLSYGSYRSLLGQSKPLGSNQHTSIFHMAACFIICAMWVWYVMHVQSHKSMFYNVLYITLCCAHPYIHYYDSYDTYDMTSANDMTLSLFLCLLRLALRKWRQSSAEQLQGLDWGVQKERKKERERERCTSPTPPIPSTSSTSSTPMHANSYQHTRIPKASEMQRELDN